MDLRIISKNRTPVPCVVIRGGKVTFADVLYPNIARWVHVSSPDPADTLTIGKGVVAKPASDPTELYYWNLWNTGLQAMNGRSDTVGDAIIPDVAMEIANFGADVNVAMTPSAQTISKGQVKTLASIGSFVLNPVAIEPS